MTSLWHNAISLAGRQHLYDIAVFRSESRLLTQHREQSLVTRPFPHEWVGSGHERRLWSDPFLMSGWGLDTRDKCDQTLSSWVGGVWTRETTVTRPLPHEWVGSGHERQVWPDPCLDFSNNRKRATLGTFSLQQGGEMAVAHYHVWIMSEVKDTFTYLPSHLNKHETYLIAPAFLSNMIH